MTDKTKNRISRGMTSTTEFVRYFLRDAMQLSSNRVKLIWFSAFSWAGAHLHYGIILPLVREVSIIYYRQNGISGTPIDLNSPYAQTILNSTDMAFTAIVVAYVASSWKRYSNETTATNIAEKKSDKSEDSDVKD